MQKELPIPQDDGAARHLTGARMPDISLVTTEGSSVIFPSLPAESSFTPIHAPASLAKPRRRAGPQSQAPWAARRKAAPFAIISPSYANMAWRMCSAFPPKHRIIQREAVERLKLPFPLVSDAELRLAKALKLPTFDAAGMTLFKRLTLIVDDGVLTKVFYPVFPPDKNAEQVLSWLAAQPR